MNTLSKQNNQELMIDTVAIKLKFPEFKVTQPGFFKPAFVIQDKPTGLGYQQDSHGYQKFVQNDKLSLTGYRRLEESKLNNYLHIEFSIPNLLFGNNLQELQNADFGSVIMVLKTRLERMGVEASESSLRKALVGKAHFGKNILLPYPLTAQDAIATLYKADVGKTKDVNIRHYGNDGQALYFYATSENIIFYDKVKDMESSKNKALDKNKPKSAKHFVKELKNNQQEILRFELRLTNQQSLNSRLSKVLGKKITQTTFEEIFDKEFCQKVLLNNWEEIVATPASQLALKIERPLDEIFDAIIKSLEFGDKKKAHSLNQSLACLGLYAFINQFGVRKVRSKVEKNWTAKSWQRLSDKIKVSATTFKELPTSHAVSEIQKALEEFTRYDFKPEIY